MSMQECENHHAAFAPVPTAREKLQATYQLEFWIPKGRKGGSWVPASPADTGAANGRFRTWRKVKPGHTHKDKLPHSIGRVRDGYATDRTTQCDRYCSWAWNAGLRAVTTFRADRISNKAAQLLGMERREVDVSEFIGPAPADEYDGYGDWDHDGHPSNTGE